MKPRLVQRASVIVLGVVIFGALYLSPSSVAAQQKPNDPRQPTKLAFTGKIGGTLVFKKDGGMEFKNMTCDTLYCDSVLIPITSNKIEKNLLQTRDFGKVKVEMDPQTGGLKVSLTPAQEKKIRNYVNEKKKK